MYTGPNISRDGLILYLDSSNTKSYPGTGTTWNDLSGNNNTASLLGRIINNTESLGVVEMDGFGDIISLGVKPSLTPSGDISVGLFVRPRDVSTSRGIWSNTTDINTGFTINIGGANKISATINGTAIVSTTTPESNEWYHIILTHNFTTKDNTLYVNGKVEGTLNRTLTYQTSAITTIGTSLSNGGTFHYGSISNVRAYNKVLTASEVFRNYNGIKARYDLRSFTRTTFSYLDTYRRRVFADGGTTEAETNVLSGIQDLRNKDVFDDATFVLVPSGVKAGKVYSELNENGDLTFTRASTATFTNAAGLIETSPRNLLQMSEGFENSYWTKSNVSLLINATLSPLGTLTAEKLVENSSISQKEIYLTSFSSTLNNTMLTHSIYVKKAERGHFQIKGSSAFTSGNSWANFDLINGVLGTVAVDATAKIEAVGNGWFRCSISAMTNSNTITGGVFSQQIITDANAPRSQSYQGDGASGVFIWGAQLEQSPTVTPYLPTTDRLNHPRIDHSSGSPALLLEPQRTNLLLRSEELDQWEKTSTLVFPNSIISPDGTMNGDIVQNTPSVSSRVAQPSGSTLLNSTTYTKSVYVKYIEGSSIFALEGATGTGLFNTRFDIILGTVVSQSAGLTSTITPLANNWFRVSHTFTSSATGSPSARVLYIGAYGSTPLTTKVAAWGAQLEVGSYLTSYIPTTTATVTRVADSFTRNNVFTNGMISAQGGTWLVELVNNVSLVRDGSTVGNILQDASGQNYIRWRHPGAGPVSRIRLEKGVSGVNTILYQTLSVNSRFLFKWNGSILDLFENGVKVLSNEPFTFTQMQELNSNNQDVPKYIKQMALWNKPLTDAQCVALTQ